MTRTLLGLLLATVLPSCVDAQGSDLDRAAATITSYDYAGRVGVIAHDSMQGRETPGGGLENTAAWIASEFERFGLRGGSTDGAFIQRYPIQAVAIDLEASSLSGGGARLLYGEDLLPLVENVSEGEATGGLVLLSGSEAVSSALASGRIRGNHVVVVLGEDADGVDGGVFRLILATRDAGAVSVIVTNPSNDASWGSVRTRAARPSVDKGWLDQPPPVVQPFRPLLQGRAASLARLVATRGLDLAALQRRAGEPVRLDEVSGLTLTLTQSVRREALTAPNVVGVLTGSDPVLRDEYVVYSAHMDHIGLGTPDPEGDSIFNGADDDASGTAAVMEIAQAMASLTEPPRRSMIFLLVSGEEKGLWGSEYFAEHPPVPLDRMVADLNIDMVGRNWPDTIVAIGREHSDLGQTLSRVNARHPELGMTAIDDLWPEERFYYRSDHYNFARKGVPILFFFNGTHDDYHGLNDEPDRIEADKASRIARLLFFLGIEVAETAERPKWNPESYRSIVGGGS